VQALPAIPACRPPAPPDQRWRTDGGVPALVFLRPDIYPKADGGDGHVLTKTGHQGTKLVTSQPGCRSWGVWHGSTRTATGQHHPRRGTSHRLGEAGNSFLVPGGANGCTSANKWARSGVERLTQLPFGLVCPTWTCLRSSAFPSAAFKKQSLGTSRLLRLTSSGQNSTAQLLPTLMESILLAATNKLPATSTQRFEGRTRRCGLVPQALGRAHPHDGHATTAGSFVSTGCDTRHMRPRVRQRSRRP
jgi:hypothetical protein